MNDIKVSLTVAIKGSQLISKEECVKPIRKEFIDKKGHKRVKYTIAEDWDKMDTHSFFSSGSKKEGIPSERIVYHTRKTIPAKQHLNISQDAYYYMVSSACPEFSKPFIWNKLSKNQRLQQHMENIADTLRGTIIEYHVFDD